MDGWRTRVGLWAGVGLTMLGVVVVAAPPRTTEPSDDAARVAQGHVVLRRLNRIEYENTINDLLGIKVNLKEQLPADGSADGFDNAGAAHHTSSFLMEKYLEAADAALNMAIANRPKPPTRIDKRYSLKDGHPVRGTTEDVYRFLEDGQIHGAAHHHSDASLRIGRRKHGEAGWC